MALGWGGKGECGGTGRGALPSEGKPTCTQECPGLGEYVRVGSEGVLEGGVDGRVCEGGGGRVVPEPVFGVKAEEGRVVALSGVAVGVAVPALDGKKVERCGVDGGFVEGGERGDCRVVSVPAEGVEHLLLS